MRRIPGQWLPARVSPGAELEAPKAFDGEIVRQSLNLPYYYNVNVARENERRGSGGVRKYY